MHMSELVLEMKNITKIFSGIKANNNINLKLYRGEIHALLGENGAGKSTLMNILTGIYKPTFGEIYYKGEKVVFKSPKQSVNLGIGMVHQHFRLIPTLSVTENIVVSTKDTKFRINNSKMEKKVKQCSERFGLEVTPNAKIWQLSVGEQQRVEIVKLLYRGTEVLILDEPSAVLTPEESINMFKTLKKMADNGKTIVFITHKMNEVMMHADRITVLRNGSAITSVKREETNKHELTQLMMGTKVRESNPETRTEIGNEIMELANVSVKNDENIIGLDDINFKLHKSEIFGIAGVAGNGQNLLAEVIAGIRSCETGSIIYKGRDITKDSIKQRIQEKISFIPEDRIHVGLVPSMNMKENFILKSSNSNKYSGHGLLKKSIIHKKTKNIVNEYEVKNAGLNCPVSMMSGGNQQKLLIGRELDNNPDIIIAAYPIRGLDIGTTHAIHDILLKERNKGKTILLISEDLDELIKLSDRIGVLCSGKLQGIVDIQDVTYEKIGSLMAGEKED
jgi:simple sugar transport system ATP-binding protein